MGRRAADTHRTPVYKRWTFWMLIVFVVILLLVIVGIVMAVVLVPKALSAKDELSDAIPLASQVQDEILSGDQDAATATIAELSEKTAAAREDTSGFLWKVGEAVPVVGENLKAVRIVAETVDDLAADALTPASEISLDVLSPSDGRFDTQALTDLLPFIDDTIDAVDAAEKSLATIDRDALISQVASPLKTLDEKLDQAATVLSELRTPVSVLPSALGAEEPRNYLMIFQGNSEVRAEGGNPAAMILVHVEDGAISIAQQASSADFVNSWTRDPVMELDPAVTAIYSDIIGKYVPNITSTPDFPTTAALMNAYWNEEFTTPLDGIMSFDPVGLSYILSATGPVELPTGDTLSADNAVSLLLNEAYKRYPDGADSDAFFAAAAGSVFNALTQGIDDPKALIDALVTSADEGRLRLWSPHEDIADAVSGTELEGVLPADNTDETTVGVYFNDTTGSKMDYYIDAAVDLTTTQCDVSDAEAPAFTADVTLTNSITRAEAETLPGYITGPYYLPGNVATDVIVYGPVGASIDSWTVDGAAYDATAIGEIGGRPVVRLAYVLEPESSVTISFAMTGVAGEEYGAPGVDTTPMVRDTPVTVTGCKEDE